MFRCCTKRHVICDAVHVIQHIILYVVLYVILYVILLEFIGQTNYITDQSLGSYQLHPVEAVGGNDRAISLLRKH